MVRLGAAIVKSSCLLRCSRATKVLELDTIIIVRCTVQNAAKIQFHPVPFLLSKDLPRNNILIGDDAIQIRFVEQLTGLQCETRERVTDDYLFGKDGILVRLLTANGLDLSPQLRSKTGVWALVPVTPGSVSTNAIVRIAAEILGAKLKKEELDSTSRYVGRLFERDEVADLRVGLWETLWIMSAPLPPSRWKEPWETSILQEWVPPGVDLGMRFGSLLKTLRAYVLIQTGGESDAKKLGVSPSKMLYLKDLRLNNEKVYNCLRVLSRWKQFGTDPRIVALSLTKVWHP